MARPAFVVRDPLWGDIRLDEAEREVLDSDIFQRLRGIKHMGTTLLVYPSAVQTRFVHSLGNLHVISQIVQRALDDLEDEGVVKFLESAAGWLQLSLPTDKGERATVRQQVLRVARLAGMCHDLGHFPMSHAVEVALSHGSVLGKVLGKEEHARYQERLTWTKRGVQLHEFATLRLIQENGPPGFPMLSPGQEWLRNAVLSVLEATHDMGTEPVPNALAELVSGEIDADRAEYLRRDGYVSGAGYGQYDLQRLIDSFVVVRQGDAFRFRPSTRALSAIEAFLAERVKSYAYIYYHNVGVLLDALLTETLRSLYGYPETLTQGMSEAESEPLRLAFDDLPASAMSHRNLVTDEGYIDDARLWIFLRRVMGAVERSAADGRELPREAARLRAYLSVLLRRRHLWTVLWKRTEQFQRASALVFPRLLRAVREKEGKHVEEWRLRKFMADRLHDLTDYRCDPQYVSVLNFLAHIAPDQLPAVARTLENRIGGQRFVVVSHRAGFKPLKRPRKYEIVDDQDRLRPLDELDPAAVTAIQALWYEGIQLRMYVLAETRLDDAHRDELRELALQELPEAIADWYMVAPLVTWHPDAEHP